MPEAQLKVLNATGLPGGGAGCYAPAGTCVSGESVIVKSTAKGERPSTLGAKLGTIAHPFQGAIDVFTYKADK
jgi:hypothetical protein